MSEYEFFLASSLQKVFPSRRPEVLADGTHLSAWKGTRCAVQLVYRRSDASPILPMQTFRVEVTGGPCACQMRKVQLIPSDFPCYGNHDSHYITTDPGLFPDLLEPMDSNEILPISNQYQSLWLSWDVPETASAGNYEVSIRVTAEESIKFANGHTLSDPTIFGLTWQRKCVIRIGSCHLPSQSLIHTEWFHADCLANYYGTETFDERHWQIIENFIQGAARHGINMLLTPVFTPPLDTAKGSIRRITQLVDITLSKGVYSFDFEKLNRWAALCKKYGILYIEIPHLFTQWGAEYTPNIIAMVDGRRKQIFGWDHPAQEPEYRRFLEAFLPCLRAQLGHLGYDEKHVCFHISDEPSKSHLSAYQAARNIVTDLIPADQIVDALSCYDFYEQGIVTHPIPGSSDIEPFYRAGISDLWVYYCCAQCTDVPNRFFAQESACTRMMGVLMYLYNIRGFLHWGFNFYNSKFSGHPINPYIITHGEYAYPSGDPFLVYPGKNGEALDSIRAEVQDEGLLDLRALQLLESLVGRDEVEKIIYRDIPKVPISFTNYPRNPQWLLNLREAVAAEIEAHMHAEK